MPLRDHFRSPVNDTHSWDEVHGQWPGEIVRALTTILPAGYRAAPKVHLGSPFEVNVSTYAQESRGQDAALAGAGVTGAQTALSPTFTFEADLPEPDEYEVRIYDAERGYPMTIGQPLPTLPIWLSPERRVTLPLESSYKETCRILGIA